MFGLEMYSPRSINRLRPGACVDSSIGRSILRRINVAVTDKGQKRIVGLIRTIEIRHRLVALVEKNKSSPQSLFGESPDMLIHAGLGSGQKPEDALDHEIRNEPAQSALSDRPMNVCGFEEIGDEAVDWKASAEGLAKYLESAELLGEGEEAGAETHGD
jgi:hypothetical protein